MTDIESTFPDGAIRDNIIRLLKEEGFGEEQIGRLQFSRRIVEENPHGLNEIIFDITGVSVDSDNWDESIPKNMYLGRMIDSSAKGKVSEIWGMMWQKQAYLY